jgi:hypothetical protein
MTCAERQTNAAGIASLPEDAPERREAVEHARACSACRAALAEGEALMRLLAEAEPIPALRAEVAARAKTEILTALASEVAPKGAGSTSAASSAWQPTAAVAAAVVGAYLLPLAGGRRLTGAGVAPSLVLALIAALATGAAFAWGGVLLAAIPVVSALASFLAGTEGPLGLSVGVHCLLMEAGLALPPLAVAAVLAWRGKLRRRSAALVAASMGGALAGQAALRVLCHAEQSHVHLLTFHTGGVLVAIALGGFVARLVAKARPAHADSIHP